jgi:hypothetical protein
MGNAGTEGAELVKARKPAHQTRAHRARRDLYKRVIVWAFIVFFALSVAGGLILVSQRLQSQ